ncbi:hypothetical protein [Actinophytocola glycyrrhizae]|uniref:Uncharacterized protein n=1 Tax=Actinophytocola glycyrrhizae TaxID=2044873 RepID=A0ABV9S8L9_9PSEU
MSQNRQLTSAVEYTFKIRIYPERLTVPVRKRVAVWNISAAMTSRFLAEPRRFTLFHSLGKNFLRPRSHNRLGAFLGWTGLNSLLRALAADIRRMKSRGKPSRLRPELKEGETWR